MPLGPQYGAMQSLDIVHNNTVWLMILMCWCVLLSMIIFLYIIKEHSTQQLLQCRSYFFVSQGKFETTAAHENTKQETVTNDQIL